MKRSRLLAAALALILCAHSIGLGNSPAQPSPSQPTADSSDTAPPPPSVVPDEGFAVRCC